MPPASHRVSVLTLAREELRALPRNAFALGAVAVLLGVFAPMAAFLYSGQDGVSDTLLFMWLIGELVVAIVVAARVASARRSRFVDSLYTTPLEQRTWFAAQAIVGAVLALLVLALQLPFLSVHIALVGMPAELPMMLLGALGMAAFTVALGLFCGVIVGGAGPGAGAGLAGGFGFVSFVLFLFHGLAMTGPPTSMQAVLLRATSLSPLSLVTDGLGISVFDMLPADLWRPLFGFAALVGGLAGAAWWGYTRAQGPLGWDARGGRAVVVALVALAVVGPVASAEVTFHEEPEEDGLYYSGGEHTQVAFVPRGAALHDETFTLNEIYDAPDLTFGRDVELDALVLVLVPEGTSVRGVRIQVEGSDAVRVVGGGSLTVADGAPSGRARPGAGWNDVSDVPPRPAYRVPVVLRVAAVEALSDSPALVEVHTEFLADGRALESHARMVLDGEIEGGQALLALAGAPLPLAAVTTLVVRKIRTR